MTEETRGAERSFNKNPHGRQTAAQNGGSMAAGGERGQADSLRFSGLYVEDEEEKTVGDDTNTQSGCLDLGDATKIKKGAQLREKNQ